MDGKGRGTSVSLRSLLHPSPQPPPLASTSPTSSHLSPALETCTSAQKNELAGSQLPGCQGQPIRRWGTLPTARTGGPGAGPEGLEGRPCLRPVPQRAGEQRQGRVGREAERKKGEAREWETLRWWEGELPRLRGHWLPPLSLGATVLTAPRIHRSMALNLDIATRHFLILLLPPCSPPPPQVGKDS